MGVRSLLFGFLVVAMVAAGCSGDDDDAATSTTTVAPAATAAGDATTTTSVQEMEVPSTTVPAVEGAFTFADDDLCEWVSEDEVAEFVATEFDDPEVTVVLDENSGGPENPDSCQWVLTSTAPDEFGSVSAANAELPGAESIAKAGPPVDFDEEGGFVEIGSAVSGHPSLSDGVVVYNNAFLRYLFWVPPSEQYLEVSILGYPSEESADEDEDDWADDQARVFGVADRFVQELGWLG